MKPLLKLSLNDLTQYQHSTQAECLIECSISLQFYGHGKLGFL